MGETRVKYGDSWRQPVLFLSIYSITGCPCLALRSVPGPSSGRQADWALLGEAKGPSSSEQPGQGGRLLKMGVLITRLSSPAAGGRKLLGFELPVRASGSSKPHKRPLGRLWAPGGLCWRMQNICAALDSTLGASEPVPWRSQPDGFVDGSCAWRWRQNHLSQSSAFFLRNG